MRVVAAESERQILRRVNKQLVRHSIVNVVPKPANEASVLQRQEPASRTCSLSSSTVPSSESKPGQPLQKVQRMLCGQTLTGGLEVMYGYRDPGGDLQLSWFDKMGMS